MSLEPEEYQGERAVVNEDTMPETPQDVAIKYSDRDDLACYVTYIGPEYDDDVDEVLDVWEATPVEEPAEYEGQIGHGMLTVGYLPDNAKVRLAAAYV